MAILTNRGALTAPATNDLVHIVDVSDTTDNVDGSSKKITMSNISKAIDLDNVSSGTTNKVYTATEQSKLSGIEDSADVTDATNVNSAGAVMEADYNANSILAATADDTPAVLTIAEQTLVGRITGGSIDALTATEVRTLLNVADGAVATVEGTAVLSTGETGGSKFLREDGDGTCSWQSPAGGGDMVLADVQSVTGLKTFDTTKLAMKGSSTGVTTIASANASGTDYTATLQAATGTIAYTSDITGTNSGTNTGDQTITLEGDVTGTGTGTFTATIANSAVTYAKMQNVSATDKVLGRTTAGAGVVEEISTTGSGSVVRATSPTLVTPILGTPTSGTLTNATGLPISGLVASTSTAIGVGSIELGHASDTTIARSGAGVVTIEGTAIMTIAGGTFTGATVAADHGTASTAQIINVAYGTGAAPTASTTPEGSLYITYTA